MTPVMFGRWETRIVMLGTLGAVVTAGFAINDNTNVYFKVLGYIAAFGIGWDIVYYGIQQVKWDRDWPPFAQWLAGAGEGLFVYLMIDKVGLPGIDKGSVPLDYFIPHYAIVWASIWVFLHGPIRAFSPVWRFHGGRFV